MLVGELRILLEGVDDYTQVIIPMNASEGFTGLFFSPCSDESGVYEMGTRDIEDLDEIEVVDSDMKLDKSFLLIPHNFFEDRDTTYELN